MNYRRTLLVFALLVLFMQVADRLMFIILPMWLLDKSFSATEIGAIFSAAGFVLMVASFLISKMSDRWGRKRIMLAGALVSSISTTFYPLASRVYDYVAVRSVQDTGRKLISSVWNAMTGDKFRGRERTRALSILGTALPLGRACAAIIGIIITTFLSVAYGFYAAAASFLIIAIIVLLFYREDGLVKSQKRVIGLHGISVPIIMVSMVAFCNSMNFSLAYTPAFFVLSRSLGLTENGLFYYYLLAYVISALFAYKTGSWIKRHGKERVLAISMALTGAFSMLYAAAGSVILLVLPLIGIAVSFYVYNIAYSNVLLDLTHDDRRGEQTGFSKLISDTGMVAGPIIGGLLIDAVSLQSAFMTAGAFAVFGALFALCLKRYG